MAGVVSTVKMTGKRRKQLVAGALLVLLAVAVGCAGADEGDMAGQGDGGTDAAREAPRAGAGGDGSSAEGGSLTASSGGGGDDTAFTTAARLPKFGPSVIKTATLDIGLPRADIGEAMNEAIAIAGRNGGFVLSSASGEGGRGTLTMRIPSQKFESALVELESLGKVGSEEISGEDVGQDFVDLEARLRNWESQEAVLLSLMDRAENVQDTIRVQSELSRVQLEIEQIRGRLRFLRDQTSYGTITAGFGPVDPVPSAPGRFARAWERAVELMQGFVEGMIVGSGVVLPLTLLALLVYLIFRALRPKLSA